mmetsp:Transcript_32954/g.92545  ORF Transcript_32954/g.92545 Transcript_32954/m.92545 type:complete len:261 (-) Transcript_32954:419-1201(-)
MAPGGEPRPAVAVPEARAEVHLGRPPVHQDAEPLEHPAAQLLEGERHLQRAREPALRVDVRDGRALATQRGLHTPPREVPRVNPEQGIGSLSLLGSVAVPAARRARIARGRHAARRAIPVAFGAGGGVAQHDRPQGQHRPVLPDLLGSSHPGRLPRVRGGGAQGAVPPAPPRPPAGDPACRGSALRAGAGLRRVRRRRPVPVGATPRPTTEGNAQHRLRVQSCGSGRAGRGHAERAAAIARRHRGFHGNQRAVGPRAGAP